MLFCTLQKKLGDLIDKQRVDKAEQLEKVDDISDSDKAELVKNIETQCQLEQDDLSYRLKLQQDEEAEKLRKVRYIVICKKISSLSFIMTSLIKVLEKHKKIPQESLHDYFSKAY